MIEENEKKRRNIIGRNVEWYRIKNGYTQENLADLVGCKQQTINSIEKGRIQRSKYLPYIAKALSINISDLDPNLRETLNPLGSSEIHLNTKQKENNSYFAFEDVSTMGRVTPKFSGEPEKYVRKLDADIPVFGTSHAVDTHFTLTDTPVDYIPRPHPVNLEKDAFGLIIGNNIMAPLFRTGDIIIIHPRKIAREQDICLFSGYQNRSVLYTIGELIHEETLSWSIRQYESQQILSLQKQHWKQCNVIIIKYFR